MTGYGVATETAQEPPLRGRTATRVATLWGGSVLAGAVLAVLAAWMWVVLSNPPKVPLSPGGGIFLGEVALNQQAGITLWFIVIGAAFGAVSGLLLGWFGQRFGWLTVVAVLLLCVTGSLLSRYLGVHLFGPDVRAEATGAKVGDLIQLGVSLDTRVAYLGWPIGGLLGVLAAISGWSRAADLPPSAPGAA